MKTWLLKFASLNSPDDILEFIINGQKTIETRSFDPNEKPNYADVKPGDKLIFQSRDTGREITKIATFAHVYKSPKEMVENESFKRIAPFLNTPQELIDRYEILKNKWGEKYKENLEMHGIVAIGFE